MRIVAAVVGFSTSQLSLHASGEDGADIVLCINLTMFDIIGILACE